MRDVVHDFIEARRADAERALDDALACATFVVVPPSLFAGPMPHADEAAELTRIQQGTQAVASQLRDFVRRTAQLAVFEHMVDPLYSHVQRYVQAQLAMVRPEDVEAALEPESAKSRLAVRKVELEEDLALHREVARVVAQQMRGD